MGKRGQYVVTPADAFNRTIKELKLEAKINAQQHLFF